MQSTTVRLLEIDNWRLFRDFRLQALENSPEHIGGDLETERGWGEEEWRTQLRKFDFLYAVNEELIVGGMTIERLKGDFGATCWIGSCWISPALRGQGIFRMMMEYVDSVASENGWPIQGLGVWTDNYPAIAIYEKLGFVKMGPPMPSTRVTNPQKYYQRMIRKSPAVLRKR